MEISVYESYIANVSPAAKALSWQALEAISQMLQEESPKTILEYGSGISTFLLASYAKEHGLHVRSFDSDRDWIEKTTAFLVEHELDEWAMVEYVETIVPLPPVDFIIWDFDKNPKRVDLMPAAFENHVRGRHAQLRDRPSL